MSYSWKTRTPTIEKFVLTIQAKINEICNHTIVGIYLHGSLTMGGFNPGRSDIDILVVTNEPVSGITKKKLAQLFVFHSNSPYPIEISFLNTNQLQKWQHPCPFDFHYSEYWRERYESDLDKGTAKFINDAIHVDPDLAAHITVLNHRGICMEGKPIAEVFPSIPKEDYISSIMGDFEDCLENIVADPIYCILNMLRVYWYLKDGVISSKQEAGEWGMEILPTELKITIQKIVNDYSSRTDISRIHETELLRIKNYVIGEMKKLTIT
ncbi:aminoglycoside adenylyltransferase domain-containing protein [Paucisalibacillus globulus]|uniref:aminoglycoside adenylyltransferase domain-containing protein n=1 Tax=Paucisalibacillus globulus TaxID=351095 RepID=UPI000410686D|nr:aminoglycoside adenylyltransferase domain-containing protein [Paucisalibacillus globulus]